MKAVNRAPTIRNETGPVKMGCQDGVRRMGSNEKRRQLKAVLASGGIDLAEKHPKKKQLSESARRTQLAGRSRLDMGPGHHKRTATMVMEG